MNKIIDYILIKNNVLLVFFKDKSSITVDIKTGARWGHNGKGVCIGDLPQWAFEKIKVENNFCDNVGCDYCNTLKHGLCISDLPY